MTVQHSSALRKMKLAGNFMPAWCARGGVHQVTHIHLQGWGLGEWPWMSQPRQANKWKIHLRELQYAWIEVKKFLQNNAVFQPIYRNTSSFCFKASK